jgi:hypothetical protein
MTAVGDMQAALERSGEYESYNAQFCKRLSDYMAIMFKFQVRPMRTGARARRPLGADQTALSNAVGSAPR